MNKVKGELKKWRDSLCSWIGRINIVNISVISNLIYRFNAISIKISACYFMDTNKLVVRFIWRRPRITNTILKEKNKVGELKLIDFKTRYKAAIIKTVSFWQSNRHTDQWNRIDPEIDPHKYSERIFDKRAKAIQWIKNSLFNKWCWKNLTPKAKKRI